MTVDELWKHRELIETVLAEKIAAELAHLKTRLELLNARAGSGQARAQAVEFLGAATPALPIRPAEVPQSEETVRNLVGSGKTAALGSTPAWLRESSSKTC